jgi:hypothetical protein
MGEPLSRMKPPPLRDEIFFSNSWDSLDVSLILIFQIPGTHWFFDSVSFKYPELVGHPIKFSEKSNPNTGLSVLIKQLPNRPSPPQKRWRNL